MAYTEHELICRLRNSTSWYLIVEEGMTDVLLTEEGMVLLQNSLINPAAALQPKSKIELETPLPSMSDVCKGVVGLLGQLPPSTQPLTMHHLLCKLNHGQRPCSNPGLRPGLNGGQSSKDQHMSMSEEMLPGYPFSRRIPLECFRYQGTDGRRMICFTTQSGDPNRPSSPFLVNQEGLQTILSCLHRIVAIKSIALQLSGEADEISEDLQMVLREVVDEEVDEMIPAGMGRKLTLPIWDNFTNWHRQIGGFPSNAHQPPSVGSNPNLLLPPIEEVAGCFMYLSLGDLCGGKSVGKPFIVVTPFPVKSAMTVRARNGVCERTDVLRELPLLPDSVVATNTSAYLRVQHLGAMPLYLGLEDVSPYDDGVTFTNTVFGHIHGGRFRMREVVPGQGASFNVLGTTITPAVVTREDTQRWEKIFGVNLNSSPYHSKSTPPQLPRSMYGMRFHVTDAALVEALHWWAWLSSIDQVSTHRWIYGTLERDGTVYLVFPQQEGFIPGRKIPEIGPSPQCSRQASNPSARNEGLFRRMARDLPTKGGVLKITPHKVGTKDSYSDWEPMLIGRGDILSSLVAFIAVRDHLGPVVEKTRVNVRSSAHSGGDAERLLMKCEQLLSAVSHHSEEEDLIRSIENEVSDLGIKPTTLPMEHYSFGEEWTHSLHKGESFSHLLARCLECQV